MRVPRRHDAAAMAFDHIRYDILAQEALRGVVRNVLASRQHGPARRASFLISFATARRGADFGAVRAQYPEDMTIVLQHQFWDLAVTEQAFEVGLSFSGIPERRGRTL